MMLATELLSETSRSRFTLSCRFSRDTGHSFAVLSFLQICLRFRWLEKKKQSVSLSSSVGKSWIPIRSQEEGAKEEVIGESLKEIKG